MSSSSSPSKETELTDTAYDILKVLGKDADFIYDTIETYIRDAQKANKTNNNKCTYFLVICGTSHNLQ